MALRSQSGQTIEVRGQTIKLEVRDGRGEETVVAKHVRMRGVRGGRTDRTKGKNESMDDFTERLGEEIDEAQKVRAARPTCSSSTNT